MNQKQKQNIVIAGLSVIGISLIAVGTWMIYPPASFISVGSIILFDNYIKSE